MRRPGDYIAVRMWDNEERRDLPGIILCADPPTGAGADKGQWVTVLTNEGHKARFVGV